MVPYQVQSLGFRAELDVMPMKEYSTFPKAPGLEMVLCHIKDTCLEWGYPSADMKSAYSTAPTN